MRNYSFLAVPFRSAALLAGMVVLWILLAPTQFGGQSSFVIIAGASMEPSLHSGDLVVALQSRTYEIGDVVTYTHPYIGPVIHRIIDVDGATFILQGDNNEWIDSYQPTREDILGKSWIALPGAANLLQQIRTPVGLALLSIAVGFMLLVTITPNSPAKESLGTNVKGKKITNSSRSIALMIDGWLFPLATLLLGSILLGIYAFSSPMREIVREEIPYTHQGHFSYQAIGASSVYDRGKIETGDPIFHALTTSFDVTFNYAFSSPVNTTSYGRFRLLLEISEPNGWQRIIELVPLTSFSEDGFSTTATIDLEYVRSLIQSLEDRTGYKRSQYDVRVIPNVFLEAKIAEHPIVEQFTPSLHFKLDDYQLYLDGVIPFEEKIDPLNPVQIGMQPEFHRIPATLNILGADLPVEASRWIAGIAFSAALIGLGIILYPVIQTWRQGESSQIALQHREILLEVARLPKITAARTIDVSSFSDLAKLAQSMGALILHQKNVDKHTYLLPAEETTFRYILQDSQDKEQA